jgi:hypothetical protein
MGRTTESDPGLYRRSIEAAHMQIKEKGYSVSARNGRTVMQCVVSVPAPKLDTDVTKREPAGELDKAGRELIEDLESKESINGGLEVRLEKKLQPGFYRIGVEGLVPKTVKRNFRDQPIRVRVGLGRGISTMTFSSPDPYSGWTAGRATVKLDEEIDRFQMKVISVENPLFLTQVSIMAGTNDASAVSEGRLIENGDFETGTAGFEWSTAYQCGYVVPPEAWDATSPARGQHCLRLALYPARYRYTEETAGQPHTLQLLHRVLWLKPGAPYVFHSMFRSDTQTTVQVTLSPWGEDKPYASTRGVVGSAWQEIRLPLSTPPSPIGTFLRIQADSSGPGHLWLDDFSLTGSESTTSVSPVEVGAVWPVLGRVLHRDKSPSCMLLACNTATSGSPVSVTLQYDVHDYFDCLKTQIVHRVATLAPGTLWSNTVPLWGFGNGIFRLTLQGQVQASDGSKPVPLQEYVFTVLDKSPERMTGSIGACIQLSPQPIEIMCRAGICRSMTLSCRNELLNSWSAIEPEEGKYQWADQRVDLARAQGMRIVACIDLSSLANGGKAIPGWAMNRGPKISAGHETEILDDKAVAELEGVPEKKSAMASNALLTCTVPKRKPVQFRRSAWVKLFENLAAHYKGRIDDWRITDEPYRYMSATEYVELLKAAQEGAKKGNSQCRVIAHGGYYGGWLLAALRTEKRFDCFDAISDYARDRDQANRLQAFSKEAGNKPISNVEYNWYPSMHRYLLSWNVRALPHYRIQSERVIVAAFRAMAWSGGAGFDMYDARFPGGDMTQLDAYKCLFEYDGALKPAGVGLAVLSRLTDGMQGAGQLEGLTGIDAYLMTGQKTFTILCLCPGGLATDVAVRLPDKVKALDFMDNVLNTDQPQLLSSTPVYLTGPLSALDAVKAALKDARTEPVLALDSACFADDRTGQYQLKLTVKNLRKKGTIGPVRIAGVSLASADGRAIPELGEVPAEGSGSVTIPLNAYQWENVAARSENVTLYLKGFVATQAIELFKDRKAGSGSLMENADEGDVPVDE